MPARLAMLAVLAAWKPNSANSWIAASSTCSRRSSAVARYPVSCAVMAILLIHQSEPVNPQIVPRSRGQVQGGAAGLVREERAEGDPDRRGAAAGPERVR